MAIRTTAILNLKGGVAKTTTAINMAAMMTRAIGVVENQPVILAGIDLSEESRNG